MRKVTHARFHQSVFIPVVGEMGNTLPSKTKTLKTLEMNEGPNGIEVLANSTKVVIPFANVVIYSYVDEDAPTLKVVPKAKASA